MTAPLSAKPMLVPPRPPEIAPSPSRIRPSAWAALANSTVKPTTIPAIALRCTLIDSTHRAASRGGQGMLVADVDALRSHSIVDEQCALADALCGHKSSDDNVRTTRTAGTIVAAM